MSFSRAINAPLEASNAAVRAAVRFGLLRRRTAPLPVVSVGNIVMGGTGKTPLVEALARTLVVSGKRPAILTRGYRRQGRQPLVLEGDPGPAWSLAGDEPSLLAKRLPQVPVVVDANRLRGAERAVALGAEVAILDDGFQHWPLARDLELVVVAAGDPLGAQSWRREGPRALRWASRIVSVGEPEEQEKARELLAPYHPLPPFPTALRPLGLQWEESLLPLAALQGRRILAFAGIANPQRFFQTLKKAGATLVAVRPFPDHHPYTPRELERLLDQAHRWGALPVTTSKDHVRVPPEFQRSVAVLEVALEALEGTFTSLLVPLLGFR